jgi:hypothetical protein
MNDRSNESKAVHVNETVDGDATWTRPALRRLDMGDAESTPINGPDGPNFS